MKRLSGEVGCWVLVLDLEDLFGYDGWRYLEYLECWQSRKPNFRRSLKTRETNLTNQ
jgi:hypothetical protein